MLTGLVFNVQRFSLHDGPGLRSTVFLKGCPLACAWCHNPESRSRRTQVVRVRHRCMRCGRCSEEELADPVVSNRGEGDVDLCPTGALQSVGRSMDSAALVKALLRDRIFFDDSGGGVTFSGGEPLAQTAFVTESMSLLRAEGVHTALDTCGFARWQDLRQAAANANLVLYDLKLMDDHRHRKSTGASNRIILKNLRALTSIHANIWVRIPVIPGVNDDDANFAAMVAFLAPLHGITRIDLLPYHATGEAKFTRVGVDNTLRGTPEPDSARLETLAAHFRAAGLTTTIGGHV
jgi:pyruvate formate lyase activating enzyme